MRALDRRQLDLGRTDRLASQTTRIHRLDARAKLLTTLLFVLTVVSFDRYAVGALIPLAFYPVWLLSSGRIPLDYLTLKLALVAPFALLLGAANPLVDTAPYTSCCGIAISGGWVSFASILLRFALTVSAALLLVAVTGFGRLCAAMSRLGVPQVLVVQLLFLYRYLFVLTAETGRLVRARALRSVGRRGQGLGSYGPLVGHLALRTMARAQRIYQAMACRGFAGEIPCHQPTRWRWQESLFLIGWGSFFVGVRLVHLPAWLGHLLTGGSL